jgi:hypothetical protein
MLAAGFSHVRIKTNVRCYFQETFYQKANSIANYDLRQDSTLMRQKNNSNNGNFSIPEKMKRTPSLKALLFFIWNINPLLFFSGANEDET